MTSIFNIIDELLNVELVIIVIEKRLRMRKVIPPNSYIYWKQWANEIDLQILLTYAL